ncbi:PAS domain S-box protein [Geothrix sp. PMB-07]|uniref:PAS domain S-box protein n=1 Tax=Geothrix sp. PMB-07 TaxID=3068640 RepID=UPI00274261F2|nr:PAS domain S-box protein [Geothrix sp. PMB-07]WLT30320.1 PAS domain S-box protein [Geothrix sp. PMB-07]
MLCLIAGFVALLSLLGTVIGRSTLAALSRDAVPMAPAAVVLVLLLAVALLILDCKPPVPIIRRLSCWMAGFVAAINLGLIVGHPAGGAFPLERWLALNRPGVQMSSPLTEVALFAAALSHLGRWTAAFPSRGARQVSALVALVPLGMGLLVLISYAVGVPLLYGTDSIPMSLPMALCGMFLGLALLSNCGRDTWPLAAFHPGGRRDPTWTVFGLSAMGLLLFLAISTLVLFAGSYIMRWQVEEARGRAREELATIAELKSRQIAEWMEERRADAEQIHRNAMMQEQLHRYLSHSPAAPSEREVVGWMQGLLQHDTYAQVVLYDAKGQVRSSAPAGLDPSAQARLEPPQLDRDVAAMKQAYSERKVVLQDLHRDDGQGEVHMSLWIPIRSGSTGSRAEGMLALRIDPRHFLYPLIQSWPTRSRTAETLLVRQDGGDVLFLSELRHQTGTALKLRFPLAAHPKLPAALAIQGREGLLDGIDYRGIPVLSVLKRVPGTDWHMVAKVDTAEVYGPLRQRVWAGGLGLVGALMLLGVGLGLLIWRHEARMVRKQLDLSQRFEWLMREANDSILLTDSEGRVLDANLQAEACYGYSRGEWLQMNVLDLRVPESRQAGIDLFDMTKAHRSLRFESIHCRKDGSPFPVEVSARARDLDGQLCVIAFIRDITERRAQEAELRKMSQLYAALSQVNQAIVWSPNQEALFDKICEVMVVFGQFDMAWIGLREAHSQRVMVAARHGDQTGYLDRIRVECGDSPLGAGPMGRAIQLETAYVENGFLTAEGCEAWWDEANASGFQSVAAFPIRRAGAVIGAIAVYSKQVGFFGAAEVALLEEAAMDISFAIDHLALEDDRRNTEVALLESERLLMEAQEAGRVGTYTWLIQEDHWQCSPFLEQIFGIGPDYPRDMAGWIGIVAPEFRHELGAYVAGIIQRHERFDLDYPIVRASDGLRRWVHGQGDIHRDSLGQPTVMVGIIQDITERKAAEQSLRKISVALEQSPLSIIITNPEGIIEYVNPAFTTVTGYSAEEAIGRNPRILKSGRTPQTAYRTMWATLTRGETWVGEFENLRKGGEPLYERATIAPVRDESGALVSYIAIKEDITREKHQEAERRSLEFQLHQSQKLESLGSLAGGVAHDMNNVLGAILGLASALREKAEPFAPEVKSLDTIMTACMRGRGVVKSLLYFAKKDLQEERPIDLNDLVREMSQLLSHTTLKRVLLKLDLQEGLGLLRGDPGALSHALMNLCVNAMDAMPGGGTLCIRTAPSEDGGLRLSVRDTGEGMPPEVLAKAMEPFFTTKPLGKGTGLGLSMVYGTMKAHDGAFRLESQPGQGTEAILTFPAARVEAMAPVIEAPSAGAPDEPERLRILLVDDDELIRESVAPLLEVLGHTVATAPGAEYAIRWLESGQKADLVVLDMNMPGMSGAEALPRILALRPELRVLMATGYSDQEVAPLLEAHSGVSSLRKPFSLKEIQRAIADLNIRPIRDPEPSL